MSRAGWSVLHRALCLCPTVWGLGSGGPLLSFTNGESQANQRNQGWEQVGNPAGRGISVPYYSKCGPQPGRTCGIGIT